MVSVDEGSLAASDNQMTAALRPVAGGYFLVGSNKTDNYHYTSKPRYNTLYSCGAGACVDISTVKTWFRQTVVGGKSRRWVYKFYKQRFTGSVPYTAHFAVQCGVNIKKAADHYCSEYRHDGATGFLSSTYANGQPQSVNFGTTNFKKYPLVRLTIDWDYGDPSVGRFRGWDTCTSKSNNRLCAATGTGH